jgi:hypothetical protein
VNENLTKEALKANLLNSITDFNKLVESLDKQAFEKQPEGKWSAGQDLKHLTKSNRTFGLVFSLPLFLLNFMYGKANRPSRSLSALKMKYAEKSGGAGLQAPGYLKPSNVYIGDKKSWIQKHNASGDYLVKCLERYSETALDENTMGHPLFGKVTVREMFMSIFIHIDHHHEILLKKLGKTL